MMRRFEAPKFTLEERRIVEIPFFGTVAAGLFLTLVSGMVTDPFRITRLKMIFDEKSNNLIQHSWWTARDGQGSTTGNPSGDRLGARESPTGVYVGRGIIRVVDVNLEFPEGRRYIKMHTFNGLGVAYIINGSCTIEEL